MLVIVTDNDKSGGPIDCIDWGDYDDDDDDDDDRVGMKVSSGGSDGRRHVKGFSRDKESSIVVGHTAAESDQYEEGGSENVNKEWDILIFVDLVLNKMDVPCCAWGTLFYVKQTDSPKTF